MLHLPREIWLNVASFVKPSTLEDLLGLNSTFYHLAMESRYRQISFAFLDNKMLRNLVRLKDPVVAKRVRILHVYPAFLNQIPDNHERGSSLRKSIRLRFADLVMGRKKFRVHPKFRTPEDIVRAVLDVFCRLPYVTDYHIMWCGLQVLPKCPGLFLTTVFQPSLRKLSLDLSLENILKLFTQSISSLSNLQELDLVIRIDHFTDASYQFLVMTDYLAPAITCLRSTLRKLAIQTWEPLNLAPFFYTVGHLPHLEHLTLGIPIESPHLGDPAGIADFLERQGSTLRSLSLRATQNSGPGLSQPDFIVNRWMAEGIANVALPNLRELDISSGLFPFSATLTCLQRFSATITSLVLTGCYHEQADVMVILGAFNDRPVDERLETLRLGSVTLTPELLDLLARELPKLYRLELIIRKIAPDTNDTLLVNCMDKIEHFFNEMQNRNYAEWQLHYFKFMLTSFPCNFSYVPSLRQLFMQCIPTICGFS